MTCFLCLLTNEKVCDEECPMAYAPEEYCTKCPLRMLRSKNE